MYHIKIDFEISKNDIYSVIKLFSKIFFAIRVLFKSVNLNVKAEEMSMNNNIFNII